MGRTVCLMLAIYAEASIKKKTKQNTLLIVGKISDLSFQLFIQISICF